MFVWVLRRKGGRCSLSSRYDERGAPCGLRERRSGSRLEVCVGMWGG